MALLKWDPFKDLLFLQERMSRIFDEALTHNRGPSGLTSSSTFPPVDIYETENSIVLKAELPGIDIDDVTVEVDENVITLRGERRPKGKNLSGENYLRMERFYGAFERAFSLPNVLDKNSVKAGFKDGVLKISVPKAAEPGRRSVKIKID